MNPVIIRVSAGRGTVYRIKRITGSNRRSLWDGQIRKCHRVIATAVADKQHESSE